MSTNKSGTGKRQRRSREQWQAVLARFGILGKQATEGKVKGSNLSAYQVIAFATHGLVPGDLRGLDQPSLAMANPALTGDMNNDGFLTISEILSLNHNVTGN